MTIEDDILLHKPRSANAETIAVLKRNDAFCPGKYGSDAHDKIVGWGIIRLNDLIYPICRQPLAAAAGLPGNVTACIISFCATIICNFIATYVLLTLNEKKEA